MRFILGVIAGFVFAFRFCTSHSPFRISSQRPQPHGGQAGIGFQPGGVGVMEDQGEGFGRDGGPDEFEVLAERGGFAVGFFDAAVAAEDLQRRPETGEDRIRPDDPFGRQSRQSATSNSINSLAQSPNAVRACSINTDEPRPDLSNSGE